jgi:hypothetical protein
MEEQTSEDQIPRGIPVFLEVSEPRSEGELEAWIVDVSKTKLRVFLRSPLPGDAFVLVKLKNHLLFGEVDYCQAEGETFDVGLLIVESLCLLTSENPPNSLIDIVASSGFSTDWFAGPPHVTQPTPDFASAATNRA